MKIAFGLLSTGLGHATRCTPLIEDCLAQGHEVYILCSGRPLEFLKKTFGGRVSKYYNLPDYKFNNKLMSEKKYSTNNFLVNIPLLIKDLSEEHRTFKKIHKKNKFDIIISDTRPGIYSPDVPSYLLSHHAKIALGGIMKKAGLVYELAFFGFKSRFTKLLIPDFEKNSMAGDYTHNFKFFTKRDYSYLGILSMMKNQKLSQDIDYFFSISGPEPQRTVFEKKILSNLNKLQGKKVVISLGKPESEKVVNKGNITIFSYLNREKQNEIMCRSKLVITRSGYSTMMDLAELGKKALLIPTKGQPEQEYLASYHMKQGNYYFVELDQLKIPRDLTIAQNFPGYSSKQFTRNSVRRFRNIVFK